MQCPFSNFRLVSKTLPDQSTFFICFLLKSVTSVKYSLLKHNKKITREVWLEKFQLVSIEFKFRLMSDIHTPLKISNL